MKSSGNKAPTSRMIPIDALIPYANNARTHSAEQIEKLRVSLREFGFVNPCLVDGSNNLIAGHGRIEAARLEGITEVPCVLIEHLTDEQRRAYILADNKLAELAGWDFEILNSELFSIINIDMEQLGFGDIGTSDVAPIDDDDVGSTDRYQEYLTFGKHKVPITEEEIGVLERLLDDYCGREGVSYGFALWLAKRD